MLQSKQATTFVTCAIRHFLPAGIGCKSEAGLGAGGINLIRTHSRWQRGPKTIFPTAPSAPAIIGPLSYRSVLGFFVCLLFLPSGLKLFVLAADNYEVCRHRLTDYTPFAPLSSPWCRTPAPLTRSLARSAGRPPPETHSDGKEERAGDTISLFTDSFRPTRW